MSILGKFITPNQKVFIKSILHAIHRFSHGESKVDTEYQFIKIGNKYSDIFFGYYDITPFNSRNNILYVKKDKKAIEVDICINTTSGEAEHVIAQSCAWNWQQGCRLRWFPKTENEIVFNVFENNKYFARVIDTMGKILREYCLPLYDIDKNGEIGLSLNFERLGVLRPGYGYTCKPYEVSRLEEESIDILNLKENKIIDRVTYNDIVQSVKSKCDLNKCYINHLSFSPSGKQFLFFWIEIKNGYHQASLLIYKINERKLVALDTQNKASHYVWLDENRILYTSYNSFSSCRYYVYDIDKRSKVPYCGKSLREDGHPSVLDNNTIITDTYSNVNGNQYIYKVNSDNDTKKQIIRIYSKPVTNGEWRTDLHPRFNKEKTKICFDSNINGNRELFILEFDKHA